MKALEFPEHNTVYAKDQPEYIPLPVYKRPDGEVTACFRLTWRERFKILFTGNFWLTILTFNQPLQPLRPSVDNPFRTQGDLWEGILRVFQTEPMKDSGAEKDKGEQNEPNA